MEPPKRCEQAKGTAARRGVNGAEATESFDGAQEPSNRGRSGMVARSTDGHKTNASLGAELLGGDGKEGVYSLELAVRS